MQPKSVMTYEDELFQLDHLIAEMGGLAEENLGLAFDALLRRDPELAGNVVRRDGRIDEVENEIDALVIEMIAAREPKAENLRHIMTALKIAGDLERIGDLAKNIAKRALAIAGEPHPKPLMTGLGHIIELALRQLKNVLDAYAARDPAMALAVWRADSQIDAMYNSLFRELLTHMMEDPRNIGTATHLLFGAKNIERVGDHTTNIAENVHFLATGRSLSEDRPKGDDTALTLVTGN